VAGVADSMKEKEKDILEQAREVLRIEAEGLLRLAERLDGNFVRCAEMIFALKKGRVIVSGIGKSGIVGRKIAATLSSTGTRAFFLHPVEAMHGDLGLASPEDVFLALSNSGETVELNALLPSIRGMGCPVVAFTGRPDSTLGGLADLVVNVGVEREACPLGLAPTASTTALLAAGDALAVALIHKRGFGPGDFKRRHPGGALGQRLTARVSDLMLPRDAAPLVPADASLEEAVRVMDQSALGAALLVDRENRLKGIVTDGDLRRLLARGGVLAGLPALSAGTGNPKSVGADTLAADALNVMERHQITVLPVAGVEGQVLGVLHLHDILGKGTVRFNGNPSNGA
jgi:arabinose-5-phosphate isomerase